MSLTLKILCGGANKMVRFSPQMYVSEAIAECIEKFHITGTGEDHGLFLQASGVGMGAKSGKWLPNDHHLEQDCESNDTLEFRKKHEMMKVQLNDGSVKTLLLDMSAKVGDLCVHIGEKIKIKNGEEFSLQFEKMEEGKPTLVWLDAYKTPAEQLPLDEGVVLLYKKKFFMSDANVSQDDPASLHLLYVESHDAIVSGKYPCAMSEAIMFAAYQCQIDGVKPSSEAEGVLRLQDYLPPAYIKARAMETGILKEHKKLVGMSEINAKFRYIQLCRSLKSYGMSLWDLQMRVPGSKKPLPKSLGLTRDGLYIMDMKTKQVEKEHAIEHLCRWLHSNGILTLDFGTWEDDYITCMTPDGEEITNMISGYIDLIMKKRHMGPGFIKDDGDQVANAESITKARVQAVTTSQSQFGGGAGQYGAAATSGNFSGLGGAGGGLGTANGGRPGELAVVDISSAIATINNLLDDASMWEQSGGKSPKAGTSKAFQDDKDAQKKLNDSAETIGQAIITMLTPIMHGSKVNSDPLDAFKAAAPLIAAALQTQFGIAKNGFPNVPPGQNTLLNGATRLAELMNGFLRSAREAGKDKEDAIARENMLKYSEQLMPALAYVNGLSMGNIPKTDQTLLELAKQIAKAGKNLAVIVGQHEPHFQSPVVKQRVLVNSHALEANLQNLQTTIEHVGAFSHQPETKRVLQDVVRVEKQNLEHFRQLMTLDMANVPHVAAVLNAARELLQQLADKLGVVDSNEVKAAVEAAAATDDIDAVTQAELETVKASIRELAEMLKATKKHNRNTTVLSKAIVAQGLNPDDFSDVNQEFIDTTRIIAKASETLVNSAVGVQKEIVLAGRAASAANKKPYKPDTAYSQGLINSAKAVIASMREMVILAQDASRGGEVDEDHMQAISNSVNAAAIKMVTAAKVKAVPNSPYLGQMGEAVKAIRDAQDGLLEKVKTKNYYKPSAFLAKTGVLTNTDNTVRQIEMQTRILKLQKELEDAQRELAAIRKDDYAEARDLSSKPAAKPAPGMAKPGPGVGAKPSPMVMGGPKPAAAPGGALSPKPAAGPVAGGAPKPAPGVIKPAGAPAPGPLSPKPAGAPGAGPGAPAKPPAAGAPPGKIGFKPPGAPAVKGAPAIPARPT